MKIQKNIMRHVLIRIRPGKSVQVETLIILVSREDSIYNAKSTLMVVRTHSAGDASAAGN